MLSEGQDGSNDLDQFFSFARDVERTILKSGRSEPTANEIQDYSCKYWRAVDHLCDRLHASPINDPLSDRSFRKFLELTVRCEAAWRSRFRPHGYPGDYRTMELFYRLEETPDKESPPKCKTPGETLVESAFARTHGIRLIQKRAKILEVISCGTTECWPSTPAANARCGRRWGKILPPRDPKGRGCQRKLHDNRSGSFSSSLLVQRDPSRRRAKRHDRFRTSKVFAEWRMR